MKTTKIKTPDQFEVNDNHIIVTSSSGHKYTITLGSCTCPGFGFHKECRHYKEAREQGLLKSLEVHVPQSIILVTGKALRKDAIRKFLTKNNLSYTESTVDKIECMLKTTTKPEEVIAIANSNI